MRRSMYRTQNTEQGSKSSSEFVEKQQNLGKISRQIISQSVSRSLLDSILVVLILETHWLVTYLVTFLLFEGLPQHLINEQIAHETNFPLCISMGIDFTIYWSLMPEKIFDSIRRTTTTSITKLVSLPRPIAIEIVILLQKIANYDGDDTSGLQ
ncbi:hypothetical protein KQX54_008162 [Cotesia glomerata]|uniref:Uncharacterized protein n=1 Tax=Cotesia glomerata TaxID=32391 RepID=A0AAV7IZA5_COTGL|nr:hypothetical protein KQX54_008162 [Cotesia glomerata]